MPSSNVIQTTSDTLDENLGLLANGSSGPWDVSVDETVSGVERWFAQIEGPSIYFYFELPSLDIIPKTIRFLTPVDNRAQTLSGSSTTIGELLVSKDSEIPVLLVQDDEFEDRFFVVVGQIDRPIMRCSLTGEDSRNVLEALRQAQKDLPQRTYSEKKTNGAVWHDPSDAATVPAPPAVTEFVSLWSFAGEKLSHASRLLNFMATHDFTDVRIKTQDFELLEERFGTNESVRYKWDVRSRSVRDIARRIQVRSASLNSFLRDHNFNPQKTYNPHRERRNRWIEERWKRF